MYKIKIVVHHFIEEFIATIAVGKVIILQTALIE